MTLPQRNRFLRRAAFTLMEMLVVVAIIVVLAGLGGYYLMGQLAESKVSAAGIQARNISQALETYRLDNGGYPGTLDELLQKNPVTGKGPYLERADALYDPWGQPFNYDPNGTINTNKGAVVVIADVYANVPDGTGRVAGNFK